jgi:hypothetical protein
MIEMKGERQDMISSYVGTVAEAWYILLTKGEIPDDKTGYVLDARSMLRQLVPDKDRREIMITAKVQELIGGEGQSPGSGK